MHQIKFQENIAQCLKINEKVSFLQFYLISEYRSGILFPPCMYFFLWNIFCWFSNTMSKGIVHQDHVLYELCENK